ncbi:macro domain-containing protein [candidate division KSB1 bacterium]|nr:macro domain-containing protein [candidate division KSB1 bacterium]
MNVGYGELTIHIGPATDLATEAIVSPVNAEMVPSAGVGQLIVAAAGLDVRRELSALTPTVVGRVVKTSAGALPSKLILHAVTMSLAESVTQDNFETALRTVMSTCRSNSIQSVGIPVCEMAPKTTPAQVVMNYALGLAFKSLKGARVPKRIVFAVPSQQLCDQFTKAAKSMLLLA